MTSISLSKDAEWFHNLLANSRKWTKEDWADWLAWIERDSEAYWKEREEAEDVWE